jgi:hypothetical protein
MKKVMKWALIAMMFVGLTLTAKTQDRYAAGNIDLFLDFGFTTGLGFAPVSVGGNFMVLDFLSVGAEFGMRMESSKIYYSFAVGNQKFKRMGGDFITRGDYHFNDLLDLPSEFDVFAGIDIGFAFFGDYKYNDYVWNTNNFYFLAGPHVGGKWFFSEKFGLHLITGWRSNDGYHLGFGLIWKLK